MAPLEISTPLIAVDAVVADTETTGLDTSKARLIEFGAVFIDQGVIAADGIALRINPGVPIPKTSTDVHGIDDAAIADAPAFAAAWPKITAYMGERLLIGHTIGFDLAVLARECSLAGLVFRPPPRSTRACWRKSPIPICPAIALRRFRHGCLSSQAPATARWATR